MSLTQHQKTTPRKPEKVYKDVIMIIDSKRDLSGNPIPLAIWEIAELTRYSRSQVSRIMKHLIWLDYVFKLRTGWANRIYKASKKWVNTEQVIKQYELYRFVKGRNI